MNSPDKAIIMIFCKYCVMDFHARSQPRTFIGEYDVLRGFDAACETVHRTCITCLAKGVAGKYASFSFPADKYGVTGGIKFLLPAGKLSDRNNHCVRESVYRSLMRLSYIDYGDIISAVYPCDQIFCTDSFYWDLIIMSLKSAELIIIIISHVYQTSSGSAYRAVGFFMYLKNSA